MSGFAARLALCLALWFAAWGALAQTTVPDLPYTVSLPVSDTSAAARDQAFSDALAQVLARSGGGADLRGRPGYEDSLKQAGRWVVSYQYQQAAGVMTLAVHFDDVSIRRLLQQLSPQAQTSYPLLLLAVSGTDGKALGNAALAPLAAEVSRHGYQVACASMVPAAGDAVAVSRLGQSYRTGLILLGQLRPGQADWTLYNGGVPQHWSDQGETPQLLTAAGDAALDRIGRNFNVISTGSAQGVLWVGGLTSAPGYAQLLALLRSQPTINQVSVTEADEQGMRFRIVSSLPLGNLAARLVADGRLQQADAQSDAEISLRWVH